MIKSSIGYRYTVGILRGRNVIIGLLEPYFVTIFFDNNGCVESVKKILPSVVSRRINEIGYFDLDYDRIFRNYLRILKTKHGFHQQLLELQPFRLSVAIPRSHDPLQVVYSVGIDVEPPHGVDIVIDKFGITHPDVGELLRAVKAWRQTGMFRFWWGDSYDIDNQGNCVSS